MAPSSTATRLLAAAIWSRRAVLARNSLAPTAKEALQALPPPYDENEDGKFRPLRWYSCGPTVYDSPHLGHARTYVTQDIIRRILTDYLGYNVFFVMGVTDIDDKIINKANSSKGVDPMDVARRYEREFWEDLDSLNVRRPNAVVRVTEHVDVIITYIQTILNQGYAYQAADGSGVYFDVQVFSSKFKYGKLVKDVGVQGVQDGETGLAGGKKDPRDFALWKAAKPGEPSWPSPFGPGRPGWHIECSAMTHAVLGDRFDVHSGGVDLKFPHHNNEIAQCEAHSQREGDWVQLWLHTGHLYIAGLKMSKSLKNFITVRDHLSRHEDPDDFRFFCLQNKYSANINYTDDRIKEARALRHQLVGFVGLVDSLAFTSKGTPRRWRQAEFQLRGHVEVVRGEVDAALRHDFDTARALRALLDLVSQAHIYIRERQRQGAVEVVEAVAGVAEVVREVLGVFGIDAGGMAGTVRSDSKGPSLEEVAGALADFRGTVRSLAMRKGMTPEQRLEDLLKLCDRYRDEDLPALGLDVRDLPQGRTQWQFVPRRQPEEKDGGTTGTEEPSLNPPRPTASSTTASSSPWGDLQKSAIAPQDLFRVGPYKDQFSLYDSKGVPTHDKDGKELSKSLRKKLEKKYEKHMTLIAQSSI